MRIVGGKYRGRSIVSPKTENIRPTKDRTRESIFNILEHSYSELLEDGIDGSVQLQAIERHVAHNVN